jgi:hypothetical protein
LPVPTATAFLIIILAVGVAGDFGPGGFQDFCRLENPSYTACTPAVAWPFGKIVLWLAGWARRWRQHALNPRQLSYHQIATVVSFGLGLTIVPRAIKRINKSRFNVIAKHSPVAYALAVLLGYCVVAGALGVSLVFAAFLAGFAVVHTKRRLFAEALDAIERCRLPYSFHCTSRLWA